MRIAALAIAAVMVSPALAQEAPEGQGFGAADIGADIAADIVEQERYETAPEAETFEPGQFLERRQGLDPGQPGATMRADEQPGSSLPDSSIIVRRPGEGRIEVTPLAPPGGGLDEEESAAHEALEDDSIGLLPEPDTLPKASDEEGRSQRPSFKRVPDAAADSIRPEGVAIPIEPVATGSRPGVRLRELDKMTGRTETVEIAVGETRQVGRLKITAEACRSPETNDPHGTFAFLKVWDVRSVNGGGRAEEAEKLFSGWMFVQSPSISALDHPRYDLWVISCTMSDVAASSGSE